MPRLKKAEPSTHLHLHIYLPETLVERLKSRFWDPMRQKPRYGALGKYVEGLIRQDLEGEAKASPEQADELISNYYEDKNS